MHLFTLSEFPIGYNDIDFVSVALVPEAIKSEIKLLNDLCDLYIEENRKSIKQQTINQTGNETI